MPIPSEPVWLILFLPLLAVFLAWPPAGRLLRWFWLLTAASLLLALSQPQIRLPARGGTVVVVADRSLSLPPAGLAEQVRWIEMLRRGMGHGDRFAVVAFGRQAAIEAPPGTGEFPGFQHDLDFGQSNLTAGLEAARSLAGEDANARFLVFSDGLWTGLNPQGTAAALAGRGIAIDYRIQNRPGQDDVAIERLAIPAIVEPRQSYLISAWVRSPADKMATYELRRNGVVHARGETQLTPGVRRLFFRDTAPEDGSLRYELTIDAGPDPVPENNRATVLAGVSGGKPILHLAPTADSAYGELLRRGGLDVRTRQADGGGLTLAELAGYSAVILENVTAGQVGTGTLNNLAPWVRETGGGLALTGGRNAYGPGGYFRSPLDPLLPVSMELRREHRKLRLAIVVALDRSGSMGAPAGAGRTKMDLANLGTVQVLDLLADEDEIGVLAVDTLAHEIVGITEAGAARAHRGRILGIASTGGGIYVYTALQEAVRMLLRAKAGTRHVVLFADAADSEEPGQYIQLLEKCRQAGITVSVVGLGTERDVDAEFLKDIARRGEGRCFFTADANEIPRLFAQDTFAVARSTFVQDPTPVAVTGELATLLADPPGQPPPLGGFNLCYARPKATVAVRTEDEYKAPVVASWQAGLGRVLCFAGEADGEYSGDFARWEGIGAFHTGLARWTAGSRGELPDQMLATQEVRDGALLVELHLDPERQGQPFLAPPTLRLLRGTPGGIPASENVDLEWQDADTLAARILLRGDETVLPSLLLPDFPPHALAPVCLPYSPEFRHLDPRRGRETLARLAAVTGGGECLDLAEVWTQLPRHPRDLPLAPWLYSLALLAFLLGIFHRRTGMLAQLALPRLKPRPAEGPATPPKTRRRPRKASAPPTPAGPPPEPETTLSPAPPTPADDTLAAMREARQRASRRTRRH